MDGATTIDIGASTGGVLPMSCYRIVIMVFVVEMLVPISWLKFYANPHELIMERSSIRAMLMTDFDQELRALPVLVSFISLIV